MAPYFIFFGLENSQYLLRSGQANVDNLSVKIVPDYAVNWNCTFGTLALSATFQGFPV